MCGLDRSARRSHLCLRRHRRLCLACPPDFPGISIAERAHTAIARRIVGTHQLATSGAVANCTRRSSTPGRADDRGWDGSSPRARPADILLLAVLGREPTESLTHALPKARGVAALGDADLRVLTNAVTWLGPGEMIEMTSRAVSRGRRHPGCRHAPLRVGRIRARGREPLTWPNHAGAGSTNHDARHQPAVPDSWFLVRVDQRLKGEAACPPLGRRRDEGAAAAAPAQCRSEPLSLDEGRHLRRGDRARQRSQGSRGGCEGHAGGKGHRSYILSACGDIYPEASFDPSVRLAARAIVREMANRCQDIPEAIPLVLTVMASRQPLYAEDPLGTRSARGFGRAHPRP
jgi:hypothetical protein